jgi:hypothetical protein
VIRPRDPAGAASPALTEARLEHHFRQMLPAAHLVALEDLDRGAWLGCVDGRRPHCVVGAPGGTVGLLILLLASLEQESGSNLASHTVDEILRRYLDHVGHFYFHTDRDAQDRLLDALATGPVTLRRAGGVTSPTALDALVRDPPAGLRAALLEALLDPAHVGCGHVRLLLEAPQEYGVRREVVEAVLRSFYRRLWDGDPRLVLDVLDGAHNEEGVARIRTEPRSGPTRAAGPRPTPHVPAVATACPRHAGLDLFVYHPDAVAWVHARQADFLAREGFIDPARIPLCVQSQQRLGEQHLEVTIGSLGTELPVFDVRMEPGTRNAAGNVTVQLRARPAIPFPLSGSA